MIVRVAAARAVGGEVGDIDFCLRLQRAGYGIYVDGTAARALGPAPTRARDDDVRNRIVLLRRYASTRRALIVSAALVVRAPTQVLAAWRTPKPPNSSE